MSRIVTNKPEYFGAPEHLRKMPAQVRCDAIQADFRSGDERP